MSVSPAKTATALLGTYASPAPVAHGGTPVNSTALDMRTEFGASLKWWVICSGSPPTAAITVQPQVGDDNSHWTDDGGAFVVTPASSTTFKGVYLPPPDELYARLVLTNPDSTNDVTAVVVASHTDSVG